jgi:nitrate reductase alpha subunit
VTACRPAEAILTCPARPTAGWRCRASRTSRSAPAASWHDLALDNEGKRITFADTQAAPVPVITSPEWSGSEHGGRRYTAFTINVER